MIGKHLRFSFNFFDHVVVSCANSSAEEIWISIFFSCSHCSTVFVSHDEKFNYLYSLCWDLIHFISIFSRLRIVQHTERREDVDWAKKCLFIKLSPNKFFSFTSAEKKSFSVSVLHHTHFACTLAAAPHSLDSALVFISFYRSNDIIFFQVSLNVTIEILPAW